MAPTNGSPKQRLAGAFAAGRAGSRALLMPFLVAGFPDDRSSVEVARACGEAGADVLEIGIPFSDPIMDGPVIQAAANQVLARGSSTAHMIGLAGEAAEAADVPVVAMTYYNLLYGMGLDRFASAIADAGLCGVIVPDLTVEESADWRKACAAAGIASVFMASVTSPDDRLRAIGETSEGFVYAASQLGVTGVRQAMSSRARELVSRIRAATELPVAVGIGVSTPEHATEVASYADGVIVGSALVKAVGDAKDPVAGARRLIGALRAGLAGGARS
jgi:tryptophan synthase alpha chain